MEKLDLPVKRINDFYVPMISNKHNNDKNNYLKDRLNIILDKLIQEEDSYINLGQTTLLHTIQEHKFIKSIDNLTTVDSNEMKKLYEQDFVSSKDKLSDTRKIYEELRDSTSYQLCSYCSINKVKTLDHYLPKSKYPMYAITPANLVPSCRDCNTEKDTLSFTNLTELFIHPYFEDVSGFKWLKAEVVDNQWPINFKFTVIMNASNPLTINTRIDYQFGILKIFPDYADKANRFFRGNLTNIWTLFVAGGKDSVKKFFSATEVSFRNSELNSWEACMYNALLNSSWFFDEAIFKLRKNYPELKKLRPLNYKLNRNSPVTSI